MVRDISAGEIKNVPLFPARCVGSYLQAVFTGEKFYLQASPWEVTRVRGEMRGGYNVGTYM